MNMQILFPGGVAVDARFHGLTVHTDQPVKAGGGGADPAPFDLFLASIGTCMGYYATRFCQVRGLDTEGMSGELETVKDPQTRRITMIRFGLRLPKGFPEKYRAAIERSMNQCAVKKHMVEPPDFEVTTEVAELAGVPAIA